MHACNTYTLASAADTHTQMHTYVRAGTRAVSIACTGTRTHAYTHTINRNSFAALFRANRKQTETVLRSFE